MFCKQNLTLGSVVPLTMFQIYLGKSFDISHVRFDVIFVLQRVGGNSWHGESPLEIVLTTSSSIRAPSSTWRFTYVLLQSLGVQCENFNRNKFQNDTWGGRRTRWCYTGSLLCIQSRVEISLATLLHPPDQWSLLSRGFNHHRHKELTISKITKKWRLYAQGQPQPHVLMM